MTLAPEQLYEWIELPSAVLKRLKEFDITSGYRITPDIINMLLSRGEWDEGIKTLRARLGDDPDGFKILRAMLQMACETYERYQEIGIEKDIFISTMKFCTRFINAHYDLYGVYQFDWAWWFPRQLACKEFRIGCLEYEFVEGNEDLISVHIPSDADLKRDTVLHSLLSFFAFREKYFPDWSKAKLYCESWLLSPALKELLPENSNIIKFQELFSVEHTDYQSMAVMDWVFPGHKEVSRRLPENTSLQSHMKAFLLKGGKVGWSKGYLDEDKLF